MHYVIGYTPDSRGKEAVELAVALSHNLDTHLDLVHVLDGRDPKETTTGPERSIQELRAGKAEGWLDEALALIPAHMTASKHLRYAHSFAEGLIDAAKELDASAIVVGAARNGLLRRFTVGSVASSLLHASPVPLALAPSGYRGTGRTTRLTCAIGTRPGADTLFEVAVDAAARRHVPLRLISLVALDIDDNGGEASSQAEAHARDVLAEASKNVGAGTDVTAAVAQGRTIEEAIENLSWEHSEIVLIGSSRLAKRSELFLGTTASKMLRALPVPMIVVPRDHSSLD